MKWKSFFTSKLNQALEEALVKDKSFSMRKMALKLEISSGACSDILRGKRNVSRRKAESLLIKAGISQEDLDYFLLISKKIPVVSRTVISQEQWTLAQSSVNQCICAFYQFRESKLDKNEIAARIGISLSELEIRIHDLLQGDLLRIDSNQEIYRPLCDWDATHLEMTDEEVQMQKKNQDFFESFIAGMGSKSTVNQTQTFVANKTQIVYFQNEVRKLFDTVRCLSDQAPDTDVMMLRVQLAVVAPKESC